MEIEKEDLSAGLAKPEFKPFQNDGKNILRAVNFSFILSCYFLLLHVTTAKGLRIYSRVEHVPLKKKWCQPRGQSGNRIHAQRSVCMQMRMNWGDQQPRKDSCNKLTKQHRKVQNEFRKIYFIQSEQDQSIKQPKQISKRVCVSHVCLLFVFRLFLKVLQIPKACEKTSGSRMVHEVPSNFSQKIKGKNAKPNHCEIDYFSCSKENHSNTYSFPTMSYNIHLVLGFRGIRVHVQNQYTRV